jgi:hypothetical protein
VSNPRLVASLAAAAIVFAAAPAVAQTKPAGADVSVESSAPAEATLAVGALQIGSAADIEVAGFDIGVAADGVVYSYYFKNNGAAEVIVAATVALPQLQASGDGSETWTLASKDAENPVGLSITVGGAPVTTKAEVRAYALGVDRLAEIKADHLPLIPFGADIDKALAALSPDAAAGLAALGVVSPPDPAQPKAGVVPDWTLEVVRSWRLVLPAGKTTPVTVKFIPVKAEYRMAKGDAQDLDDMKDEICLRPQALSALQSRLKGGGAWNVTDMALTADAPAHWIDTAQPTLSVQKPKPDAIVAFCGMDEKTASRPAVLGTAPDENDGIRVVIFEPAGK